jgi:D-alanyl-D-alanine carboxypeptidase (penicillin-binding protein 5/6)
VALVAERAVKVLIPRDSNEKLLGRVVYVGPLIAPVEADKQVAHLKVFRGTQEVLDLPLKTATSVEAGSLSRRAVDAGWEYASGLFRKYVLKH